MQPAAPEKEAPAKFFSVKPSLDLSGLDFNFEVVEGFSRPSWKSISAFIKTNFSEGDWSPAWTAVVEIWLEQLAKDLGGDSAVYKSENFRCLSDLTPETTQTLLRHAEFTLAIIRNGLKEAAWHGCYGKHVLLLYSDPEDYYAYISYFCPEGNNILSAGVFLRSGYAHVALPFSDISTAKHAVVHELVHNLVCHLKLPLWLNEGLAVVIEKKVSQQRFLMDRDLVRRHSSLWSEQNIQAFWSGKSFNVPGDESHLSYGLAEILVTLLSEQGTAFVDFVINADWRDGGQDAALNFLGSDLGEVVAGFLGPGNWRPQRKSIAGYVKQGRNQPD